MLQTITWTNDVARIIDQTQLPARTVYLNITDEKQMHAAIRRLSIRGAPAIGVAAAFGVYLGVRDFKGNNIKKFFKRLNEVCDYLATSRPTAVNLFWAIERIRKHAGTVTSVTVLDSRSRLKSSAPVSVSSLKSAILSECKKMLNEDIACNRAIGEHGAKLLKTLENKKHELGILTHCNAGSLATVKFGTALAPIYVGKKNGMKFHVFADETRPLLQGARITAFELAAENIPVTVICDNMAATVMRDKKVRAVIVGADRIAANGDVANKIGTLNVAILAGHFGIPFFVAAPTSTIDLKCPTGEKIPIEERDPREIKGPVDRPTVPDDVEVFNPAFDVTPNHLVSAIITEKGVHRAPYKTSLKRACTSK